MSDNERLVEVYKAVGEMEAQVIKGLLESYGISCILRYRVGPSPFGATMNEVSIMVRGSDAGRASELIKSDRTMGEDV